MNDYPPNWREIAERIKSQNGWKCERCGHPHEVETGYVLTVHHLDGDKANCEDWNLAALCQRCHLSIQSRVRMDQLFFAEFLPVSEWFKPHLAGYQASLAPTAPVSATQLQADFRALESLFQTRHAVTAEELRILAAPHHTIPQLIALGWLAKSTLGRWTGVLIPAGDLANHLNATPVA